MSGGTIRALRLAGAVAAASLVSATAAQAGAFGLREQSAQGLGLAFAGSASGAAGVSSLFWNPATVTMRPGFVTEQNLSFVNLSAEITPTVGTAPGLLPFGSSGEMGQGAVLPSGATSYQLTDRLWVGLQTGAPYGLVTKPRQDWAGSPYARSSHRWVRLAGDSPQKSWFPGSGAARRRRTQRGARANRMVHCHGHLSTRG